MTTLHLRQYQKDAIASVLADWQRYQSVLLVASMGAGKTVMFIQILADLLDDDPFEAKRGLVLAHRLELVEQPLDKIREFWPEWEAQTGIVMADKDECDRQLILATVQTLSRPKRLERLLRHGPIDYLVRDEAHHATSKTDMALLEALKAANPKLKVLGVTATPIRADGDGLKKVYQKISAKYGIKELIELGYLVPFKALGVQTAISLKFVKESDGDFTAKSLSDVWEVDNVFDLVVESHKRWAGDRPTIAFTVTVEGAYRLAEKFRAAGYTAEAADGTTAKSERRGLLERFKAGEVNILVNVGIWTEGLDLPKLSCAHMVRPTKSDGLYCQCVGRVLRTYPQKEDALILDYAPADARNIVLAGDLLGKPRQQKELEEKAQKAGVVIQGFSFTGEGNGIDGDPDELVTRPLHYLSASPFAWFYHDNLATLGLGETDDKTSRTLAIAQNSTIYSLLLLAKPSGQPWHDITVLARGGEIEPLIEQGADYAEQHGAPVLTNKDRAWMREPASEKQITLLHRLMPKSNGELSRLSKGECARLLTSQFARRALTKAGYRV